MYAMVATRPDLAFAVTALGRSSSASTQGHLIATKKTLRYLRKSSEIGFTFGPCFHGPGSDAIHLIGYCDSDWAGDLDTTRRSTTGYVFLLTSGTIS